MRKYIANTYDGSSSDHRAWPQRIDSHPLVPI